MPDILTHIVTACALSVPCLVSAGVAVDDVTDSLPAQWLYTPERQQPFPTDDPWWRSFNDPLLDSLIAVGEKANFNLLAASRRIETARQNLTAVRSALYPTVSLNAGWTKNRTSADMTGYASRSVTTDYFSAGASASWEIDLFGRVRAKSKEAKAQLSGSRADYAAMSVSVCSEIASAYITLRTLQQQLAVTQEHVAEQERVMKITEARFEASLASMLDVSQARTIYYSTRASLVSLHTSIATAINSIAVLTGCYPQQLAGRLSVVSPQPDFTGGLAIGVPADLLRRRPDIAQAEYNVAACAAAIGVAKKDYLPVLSIDGSIGTSAHRAGDLMTRNSLTYTVAPTLSWTLFDGFARRAAVASAKEDMMAAVDSYNMTVLTAVQEVENAVVAYDDAVRYEEEISETVKNAQKAFELSLDRYKQGLDAFINVAQSQISLLQYANELVAAKGRTLSAAVDVYKAAGGGWSVDELNE